MERGLRLRTDQQLAVDMASMILALNGDRQSALVLTDTALRVFLAVEPLVTEEVRDRVNLGSFTFTPEEVQQITDFEAVHGQMTWPNRKAYALLQRARNRQELSQFQETIVQTIIIAVEREAGAPLTEKQKAKIIREYKQNVRSSVFDEIVFSG
jgi:hypothetical protein